MSSTQDDYAPTNTNPSEFVPADDTEPADPSSPDHAARRNVPLAPASVKPDRLPDPFVTDNGRVETVAEAGETYLRVQRWNWNDEVNTSGYERHKRQIYPRILEADRYFRSQYPGLTTVMLTRRLSPLDEGGNWLTPWECNEMLHGGKVHRSLRQALNYELSKKHSFEYEWVGVTAPTESAGTPHEHIYLWIDDPGDDIETGHIKPALDKHLKYCNNAYEKDHWFPPDEGGRALTVQHDPALIESTPAGIYTILENSPTYAETNRLPDNTRGAQYLASQLAHLPIGDYYNSDKPNPRTPLFEGAALAWASPRNWFRASRGVPALGKG